MGEATCSLQKTGREAKATQSPKAATRSPKAERGAKATRRLEKTRTGAKATRNQKAGRGAKATRNPEKGERRSTYGRDEGERGRFEKAVNIWKQAIKKEINCTELSEFLKKCESDDLKSRGLTEDEIDTAQKKAYKQIKDEFIAERKAKYMAIAATRAKLKSVKAFFALHSKVQNKSAEVARKRRRLTSAEVVLTVIAEQISDN